MLDWVTGTITTLGYPGIALLMFLENFYPPLPSELIMPLGGFTASNGELNLFLVALTGAVGSVLGTLIWYYAGKLLGEERTLLLTDRYGKWLAVSRKDVERALYWFNRYNKLAVFLGRIIPGVRWIISIPAGISKMPLTTFLIFSATGTFLWTLGLTYAGFLLGQNWEATEDYATPITIAVLVVFVIWYLFRFIRLHRQSRRKSR
ncbi:MAG TPA: DedA family protein [Candidatus Paceibacterota bacterium]|nr:DedA family protein [Candidatus Paceibacterota bacterium]